MALGRFSPSISDSQFTIGFENARGVSLAVRFQEGRARTPHDGWSLSLCCRNDTRGIIDNAMVSEFLNL